MARVLNSNRVHLLVVAAMLFLLFLAGLSYYYSSKARKLNDLNNAIALGMPRAQAKELVDLTGFSYTNGYRALVVSERVWFDIWVLTFSFDEQGVVYDKMISDADLILF